MRRVATKPSVIAGLKWPPEMWPRFDTMIPIARPFASATATMSLAGDDARAAADEDERERADELGDTAAEKVYSTPAALCEADRTLRPLLRSRRWMTRRQTGFEVECPHCHKTFDGEC